MCPCGRIRCRRQITLNHLRTAAMHLMANYFEHLLSLKTPTYTVAQTAKRFEPSTVLWASHTIQPSSLVCLFVCLFVTLLNVRDCAPDFAMKAVAYRNDFNAMDREKFVVVHPCSTFSDCCQLATTLNAKFQKGQIWGFLPTEGDRINRSRRNLARKRIPRVCYSTPYLALNGKRGSVQEPRKRQNLPKIVFFGHRKPTQ